LALLNANLLPQQLASCTATESLHRQSRSTTYFLVMHVALKVAAPTLLAIVILTPVWLHYSQKSHNRLPFDIEEQFPAGGEAVTGEIFAATLIALVDRELAGPVGWRPNDFVLWGPDLWADNNSNRQIGIIQALRESVRVLKDHLTKVSATVYDPKLVDADTKLRNDEFKFWFPSAESRFASASESLRAYIAGLHASPQTSKPINRRNVELIRLFGAWTDLLGGAHAKLYEQDVSTFDTDDHFYKAQGFAHVMAHLTRAVMREYAVELEQRQTVIELLDQIEVSLSRAAVLKPLMVLDGRADGLFANHRRNLDVYIVDARQLLYSVREELEK
jgi:hypothetical protein